MKTVTARDRARAYTGGTVAPSPRDRTVKSRGVRCPTCDAEPGDSCISSVTGKETSVHPWRRRMALRAENSEYNVADVTYARQRTLHERRAARVRSGLTLQATAELVGARHHTQVVHWEQGSENPSGPIGAAYGRFLREHLTTADPDG